MKFLAVFFLVGLALCYSVPVSGHQELSVDEVDELDRVLSTVFQAEDDDVKTTLQRLFDRLLERVAENVEKGKELNNYLVSKMKAIIENLKEYGVDLTQKLRERGEKLTGKAKEVYQKLLEKLGINKENAVQNSAGDDEVKSSLQRLFDKFLDVIAESSGKGNNIQTYLVNKMKAIIENLKEYGVDLTQKLRERGEKLTGKAREVYQNFLERLGINKENAVEFADDGLRNEGISERLKKVYEKALEKIKEVLEKGKEIGETAINRLKDMRDKMGDKGINLDSKMREILSDLTGKAKERFEKILEKLGIPRENVQLAYDRLKDVGVDRLKEMYERALKIMKEYSEEGKEIHERVYDLVKEIRYKLKDNGINMDSKASDILNDLTGKAKERFEKNMDKICIRREIKSEHDRLKDLDVDRLKEMYERALNIIKKYSEEGKEIHERVINLVKGIRYKFEDNGINMDSKARDILNDLTGEAKERFEKNMDKLCIRKENVQLSDDRESVNLREQFEEILRKIKDAVENGKSIWEGLERFKEVKQRLKDLKIELGEKTRELVEEVKEKVRDYFKRILEKQQEKRSINFKDLLRKLRDRIRDEYDPEKVQAKIEEVFGKGSEISEQLIKKLKERGENLRQRLLDFINRLLGEKEKRSLRETYERVREYLRNLKIELKERLTEFGEWAKGKFEKGLQQGKDRAENLRILAREFISDARLISKDVAEQAKGFFREYKEDLGVLYDDVRQKIREILQRND